jgi:hypothetical protein
LANSGRHDFKKGIIIEVLSKFSKFFYRISWHKFCMGFHCGSFFFAKICIPISSTGATEYNSTLSYRFCFLSSLSLVRLWSARASVRGEALFSWRGRGGLVFCRLGSPPFLLPPPILPPLSHSFMEGHWRNPPSWLPPSMSLACLTGGCVAARGVRFSSEDAAARRSLLRGRCGPTACGLPVVDPAARRPFQQWRR